MNEKPTHVTINFFIFGQDETLDEPLAEQTPGDGILQRWNQLSPREQQIAMDAARNMTNNQIGFLRSVSPQTVKTHMKHILNKLNLRSKNDLRFAMLANGLVQLEEGGIDDQRGS